MYTIEYLYTRYPVLESCRKDIDSALQALIACYDRGGKLLCCGNGGSTAAVAAAVLQTVIILLAR